MSNLIEPFQALIPEMSGPPPGTMHMPTSISIFPKEFVRISRRWAEKQFIILVHFNAVEAGGHFAALEHPMLLTEDIRTNFRGRRT